MHRFNNNPFAPLPPGDPHADLHLSMESLPHPDILRAIGSYNIPILFEYVTRSHLSPEMENSIGYISTFACEIRNIEMLERIDQLVISSSVFKWGNSLEYAIETGDFDMICFLAPRYVNHFYPESKRIIKDPIHGVSHKMRQPPILSSCVKEAYYQWHGLLMDSEIPDCRKRLRERCFQVLIDQGLHMYFESEEDANESLSQVSFRDRLEWDGWWRSHETCFQICHYIINHYSEVEEQMWIDSSYISGQTEKMTMEWKTEHRCRCLLLEEYLSNLPQGLVRYTLASFL